VKVRQLTSEDFQRASSYIRPTTNAEAMQRYRDWSPEDDA
jgi:hypothetical protein